MDRRKEILHAAYSLAADHGIEKVSPRAVAAKLGMSHATVHYYFARRGDLVAALADHLVERLNADRRLARVGAASQQDRLEAEFAMAEGYGDRRSHHVRAMAAMLAVSGSNRAVTESLSRWVDSQVDALRELGVEKPRLLAATLLGLAVMGQMDGQPAEAELDALFTQVEGAASLR